MAAGGANRTAKKAPKSADADRAHVPEASILINSAGRERRRNIFERA